MTAGKPRRPAAPAGLEKRGRRFWRSVLDDIDFDLDALELLEETCRTLDTLDRLRVRIDEDGEMVKGSMGQPVAHPLLAELRQQRKLLADFLNRLGIEAADEQPVGVPLQVVPDPPTFAQQQAANRAQRTQQAKSRQARKAAGARWGK